MFENMKLGTKLVTSFVAIALIGLIVAAVGVFNMMRLDGYINTMYHKDFVGLSYVKEAKNNRLDVGRHWRNAILERSPEGKRQSASLVKKNIDLYKENLQKGGALFYSEKGKKISYRT